MNHGMDLPADIQWLSAIGLLLRLVTLVFTTIFIVRYSRRPWRTLPEGRHLMGFSCVVWAFMLFSVVNNFAAWMDPTPPTVRPDGYWPGRELTAVILFGFTAWYMYKRNALLVPQEKLREEEQRENDLHDNRLTGADRDDVVDTKE